MLAGGQGFNPTFRASSGARAWLWTKLKYRFPGPTLGKLDYKGLGVPAPPLLLLHTHSHEWSELITEGMESLIQTIQMRVEGIVYPSGYP